MDFIFPVNSKKEKKEDEEFGLDTLFEKWYKLFKNEKIPYHILLELENGEETQKRKCYLEFINQEKILYLQLKKLIWKK